MWIPCAALMGWPARRSAPLPRFCCVSEACFASARSPRPVRRILFVELSEMGTTILAEPAMRKARAHFPATLYFVIFARNVGSLELLGTVPRDSIFTISDRSLFALARDTLALLQWTRRKKIDTVVDLELFS